MVCRKTASPVDCRKTISVQSSTRATTRAALPAARSGRTNSWKASWTLREFKTYGGSIVPATVKSNPGNDLFSSFASEDPRKRELEDYLVTQDALDNIRGIRSQKGAAGERSVFTFAFGLTTAGLDHLNSFDSMAESPAQGDVVEAFENCRESGILCLPSKKESRPSSQTQDHHLMPTTLCIESELRRVPDAITTATATRSSG